MGFLKRLFSQRGLWQGTNSARTDHRTVMLVAPLSGEHDTLRVLSMLQGWHLRTAPTFAAALELRGREKITVILYDQDLPGIDWRNGVAALLKNFEPACVVLLSFVVQERLRMSLLTNGGYDVARKPIEGKTLVRLVNGALALVSEINSSQPMYDGTLRW